MIWVELLACVVIWLSFWSLIPRDEWWFRGADFPRLQILALGLIAFILMLIWDAPWNWVREVILLGLIAAVSYQLKMEMPYTFMRKKQVKTVARTNQPNVAETISNHKKSTVQKTQVNGKSARKTVTKQPEKGRKK